MNNAALLFDKDGEQRAVWRDQKGVTHQAVGDDIHREVRLLWTKCEAFDIPANKAWYQRPEDKIDCVNCKKLPK